MSLTKSLENIVDEHRRNPPYTNRNSKGKYLVKLTKAYRILNIFVQHVENSSYARILIRGDTKYH